MSEYLEKKGVREFGVSGNGNSYRHLLRVEDGAKNFISRELYDLTLERFDSHKAGDLNRILTNTASSQAYCFNLFLYLNQHKALAHALFSQLMGKTVMVEHIELEFTPNQMQVDPFSESATPSGTLTGNRLAACPFRYGLNQLWRNMLLAERVAEVRHYDAFDFWVVSPRENDDYLWKQKGANVEQLFRETLTEKGNRHFRKVHLEEIYAVLEAIIETEEDKAWLSELKEKYVIG